MATNYAMVTGGREDKTAHVKISMSIMRSNYPTSPHIIPTHRRTHSNTYFPLFLE